MVALNTIDLQKLQGEWVQALGEVISGIVYMNKREIWLVDGTQDNHEPITSSACSPKRFPKTLHP